jgi:peptide/nickel transport system substrate-binding protein
VLWDLSRSDKASDIKPGLATEWQIDEANFQRWIFKLRQGIKWHDGCDFKADDVLWNLSRSTNDKTPEFDPSQFAQARSYLGNFAGVQKIDDYTVAFDTKGPDSLFPYEISYVLLISPCRAREVNYNWAEYALRPSGTGPYRPDRVVPRAAPAPRIRSEYGVLGKDPGAQPGPAGADPDAGSLDPTPRHCCPAR